jgi:hypothetical protein
MAKNVPTVVDLKTLFDEIQKGSLDAHVLAGRLSEKPTGAQLMELQTIARPVYVKLMSALQGLNALVAQANMPAPARQPDEPSEPAAPEAAAVEPVPSEPAAPEAAAVEPVPSEPAAPEAAAVEPVPSEPAAPEAAAVEPVEDRSVNPASDGDEMGVPPHQAEQDMAGFNG